MLCCITSANFALINLVQKYFKNEENALKNWVFFKCLKILSNESYLERHLQKKLYNMYARITFR